jgi:hypothetical protein
MIKYYLQIGIISVIVIAAIIFGFTQVGLPATQRDQSTDQARISGLSTLGSSVQSYYYSNRKLPASLAVLPNISSLKDPETGKIYEYKIIGSTSYQLCATFKTDTTKENSSNGLSTLSYNNSSQKHPKGYYCFVYKVTSYNSPQNNTVKVDKTGNLGKCQAYSLNRNKDDLYGKYIVQVGDTLASIAQNQMNDKSRAADLIYINKDNHPSLSTDSSIKQGWTLYIPPYYAKKIGPIDQGVPGLLYSANGEIVEIINDKMWSIQINQELSRYGIDIDPETQFVGKAKSTYEVGDCIKAIKNENNSKTYAIYPQ